jgi:hypothetical protein
MNRDCRLLADWAVSSMRSTALNGSWSGFSMARQRRVSSCRFSCTNDVISDCREVALCLGTRTKAQKVTFVECAKQSALRRFEATLCSSWQSAHFVKRLDSEFAIWIQVLVNFNRIESFCEIKRNAQSIAPMGRDSHEITSFGSTRWEGHQHGSQESTRLAVLPLQPRQSYYCLRISDQQTL